MELEDDDCLCILSPASSSSFSKTSDWVSPACPGPNCGDGCCPFLRRLSPLFLSEEARQGVLVTRRV
jgi:hypothetical protein